MQNFEKILSRTSSQSVLPTISPSASSASERSEAVSSAGADSIILSFEGLLSARQSLGMACPDCHIVRGGPYEFASYYLQNFFP